MSFKPAQFMWLACMAISGFALAASAVTEDSNPYAQITNGNVFRLVPPPVAAPVEQKPVDLPKVMLSGFWTVGNSVKVLLAVPGKDSKEPPTYLTLANGEGSHDLEVVTIRADKEEVDIINSGTPQTLTLKSNSFASTAAPAPGRPGPPGMPMPHHGFPGAPKIAAPVAAATGGSTPLVIGGNNGSDTFSSGSAFVSGGANSSGGNTYGGSGFGGAPTAAIPSLLTSPAGQYQMPPPAPAAPPEQQAINILALEKMGGPPAPPIMENGGGPPAP